ncbi:MAG TPA: Asp-tRNA(Asn)/Glu-tRNA(Gln) amidotransferase subunit GatC [Candidatus Polarisedimenticolia bacterium]|jgi:aspartyl-tRNA(Asn)/glutamyl-tRNA(Gln) amidotransferase subunit C|nr:Asp-tRNA(Asn)/Glu-tRNA(Gln) amidotransferase subunit GatC [Candidatus Polarisedimenticolia bacterium]
MSIPLETVRHIARLANLEFADEELEVFARQLNSILLYIEKLDELETQNVQPTSHVTEMRQAFREDLIAPSLEVSEALANAPESKDGHFAVPKVIG